MPAICYEMKTFSRGSWAVINQANEIIADYQSEGLDLTLRQLYYQFVARDLVPNNLQSYKRLGSIINNARLAGLIDWTAIEDRTRSLTAGAHWESPADILASAQAGYQIDKWLKQPKRVEVWVEKEALAGVVEQACEPLDVPYFSCRGYVSQSEQWRAGQRFADYLSAGQEPIIIHLGDHDPSGIDMTRDNRDRLTMFSDYQVTVERIALNMDQVEELRPPPNPAKITDSRAEGYILRFGRESWELDALDPRYLRRLITQAILRHRDPDLWDEAEQRENDERQLLADLVQQIS